MTAASTSPPTPHLLAERAGPAVVRIPSDDLPGHLVNLDAFTQPANVIRALVKVCFPGVKAVDLHQQAFDRIHESLVSRATC
jgi:hypothetical protein